MTNVTRRDFLGTALLAPAAMQAANALRPNFLYLLPDQFRFDWLSGDQALPVRTPSLDALARRGVRFTKAAVAAPLCAPSRACLATGCEYDECGVASNAENFSLSRPTYYRKLRDSGYHTAACGKLDLSKAANEQGIDGRQHMEEWGFSDMINCGGKGDAVSKNGAEDPHEPYMLYLKKLGLAQAHADDIAKRHGYGYSATFPTPLPDEHYCDNWVGRTGLELMKRFPPAKPWHLVVNFVGPHDPEDITVRMERTVRGRRFRQPNACTELTPDVHNAIRQNYTAMVENLDRWVGIYVEELNRRGELDNTIVVFSSDHGEMLGDHDRWAKTVPYEASLCVPLIAAGPGIKPQRSNALVSIIDIGATFLDYADAGKLEGQTARSFRPLLAGRTWSHREFVSSGLFGWRLVSDGRYKLIRGYDPDAGIIGTHDVRVVQPRADMPPLLFDLESDPLENSNIAAKAPDVVTRLSKLLPPPNPDPRFNRDPRLSGERRGGGRWG
jgi:arylsulfatase A-like enzyme